MVSEMRFTKIQALGNDFLIIPVDDVTALSNPGEMAREMCGRNYGAGADGIVFVARSQNQAADFTSRIFNADGSEAEISGNGTRCVAAYVYHSDLWNGPSVRIETVVGVKEGRLAGREATRFEFEFDMGEPRFSSLDLQMTLDEPLAEVVGFPLKVGQNTFEVTCVSMGNPHCSLFLQGTQSINPDETGPRIENHPLFSNRTNVEFVRVISPDEIEVSFWERGVGRTLSSGTGSSAASVAAMLNNLTGRDIRVRTPGGNLRVEWRADNRVMLTGEAEVIYEGRWLKA